MLSVVNTRNSQAVLRKTHGFPDSYLLEKPKLRLFGGDVAGELGIGI